MPSLTNPVIAYRVWPDGNAVWHNEKMLAKTTIVCVPCRDKGSAPEYTRIVLRSDTGKTIISHKPKCADCNQQISVPS